MSNEWFYNYFINELKTIGSYSKPNPNALTFTGAVTGSYDGSEAVTVEIPSGDMLTSVYDPQGKAQDVFAYVDNAIANAIGTALEASY